MGHHPDQQDFEQAIVAAYPRLFRYARQLTRNDADAGDLLQDTIARGYSRRGGFRRGTAVDRWMFTILRRLFLDRCRHAQVEQRAGQLQYDLEVAAETAWTPEDEGESRTELWELYTIADVRSAAARLAPCLRRVYMMFAFERRSYAQIGALLAIPSGTVATRVSRARLRLRQLLLTGGLRAQPPRNDNRDAPVSPAPAAARAVRRGKPASAVGLALARPAA
jgi:RNA polymerase sigma-70 factor (ECF subfamily)